MRIWDIPVSSLCRQHLLAKHRELHAIWDIITKNKKGYSRHPEVLRWQGKTKALFQRHQEQVQEMEKRKYQHRSPLNKKLAKGKAQQDLLLNSIQEQYEILTKKGCSCLNLIKQKRGKKRLNAFRFINVIFVATLSNCFWRAVVSLFAVGNRWNFF